MKTNSKIFLLAVATAALTMNATTASAQLFSATDVAQNHAIAASPRAKEAFPWLGRQTATPAVAVKSSNSRSPLAEVRKNRALAASPRMLEQFPELGRPARPAHESSENSVVSTVLKNRAFAASPRAIEQFPWLVRGAASQKRFEVAPAK